MVQTRYGMPEEAYFQTRFEVLREPLGMPLGSERLEDDAEALHAWVVVDGLVVSVGRAHVLSEDSDGSGVDHKGPGAALIPPFGPLARNEVHRPAFQIRQMGTLEAHRRGGLAAQVLEALEAGMVTQHGARTGFLQAREHAIGFYQSQGWKLIDEPYSISNIGPHRSMMKTF